MPYALKEIGSSGFIRFPALNSDNVNSNIRWDLEFSAANNNNSDTLAVVSGTTNLNGFLILRNDNTIDFRQSSSPTYTFSVADTNDDTAIYRFEMRWTGGNKTLSLYENSVFVSSVLDADIAGMLEQSTAFSINNGSRGNGIIRFIKYTDLNNSANNMHLLNSAGTGTAWPDISGNGNDGTQAGTWPADNSEWVFYSSGNGVVMTISEATTAADTESAQANLISTISLSTTATDANTGKLSASLSLTESAGASDTDQGQYATSQQILEAVQANDLTDTLFHALLTQNLTALASDTVSLKANYGLTLNETAAGVDSATGKASLIATLSESATGSDSVSMPTDGVVTLNIGEVSTASDGVSMSASFTMTLSESAQASDSLSNSAAFLATIAESLSASDTFGGFSPSVYTLTIGEAVTALDSVSAALAGLRGFVTATITIEPTITGAATTEPAITGTITVS